MALIRAGAFLRINMVITLCLPTFQTKLLEEKVYIVGLQSDHGCFVCCRMNHEIFPNITELSILGGKIV